MSHSCDQADSDVASGADPIPEPEGRTEIIETSYEIGQDNIARGSVRRTWLERGRASA